MKKTLVSALTAALVVGAASTTFAAANPFSDVPAGHWAYDAVAQLAQDGVIEGYGDNTFQGDKNITRYEMAQMVAKAMAKTNTGSVSSADKAMVDKLAAEFSDELNNLGVRVANLEKNADKVKWNGEMRNLAYSDREEGSHMKNTYKTRFRLLPTAEVNNNWHVKAKLDANIHPNNDDTAEAELKEVYAVGAYPNYTLKLGKMPYFSDADEGLIFDDAFSGAQVTFGKQVTATVSGGRYHMSDTADVASLDLGTKFGKLNLGAGYYYLKADNFKTAEGYDKAKKEDKASILTGGARYTFDKNVALAGSYAENSKADAYNKSGNVEVDYKGADKANAGTWGAYLAYRHVGANVSLAPTYDTFYDFNNAKGWEIGGTYAPFKNVMAWASYFDGKDLATDNNKNELFGRLSFFF
jgi:hypothetical protein